MEVMLISFCLKTVLVTEYFSTLSKCLSKVTYNFFILMKQLSLKRNNPNSFATSWSIFDI